MSDLSDERWFVDFLDEENAWIMQETRHGDVYLFTLVTDDEEGKFRSDIEEVAKVVAKTPEVVKLLEDIEFYLDTHDDNEDVANVRVRASAILDGMGVVR